MKPSIENLANSPKGNEPETASPAVQPLPRYLRLPRSGQRCPHTGLSRSALNSLILGCRPLVKSISLGARHGIRGTRLICGESLAAYLQSLEEVGTDIESISDAKSSPLVATKI